MAGPRDLPGGEGSGPSPPAPPRSSPNSSPDPSASCLIPLPHNLLLFSGLCPLTAPMACSPRHRWSDLFKHKDELLSCPCLAGAPHHANPTIQGPSVASLCLITSLHFICSPHPNPTSLLFSKHPACPHRRASVLAVPCI